MFEVPFYAQHVEEELQILKKEEKELDAKLEKAEAKLAAAKKKWAAEAAAEAAVGAPGPAAAAPAPAKADDEEKTDEGKVPMSKADKGSVPGWLHGLEQAGSTVPELGHPSVSSPFGFWGMDAAGKRRVIVYAFVNAITILLCAYLYYQAKFRYPSYFMAEQDTSKFPNRKGFGFDFFSCLTDRRMCVLGCCCSGCRWADTLSQQGLLSYWRGIGILLVAEVLSYFTYGYSGFFFIIAGIYYRQKLRERFQIESKTRNTIVMDCCAWFWCTPCAIIQEAREEAVHRGA